MLAKELPDSIEEIADIPKPKALAIVPCVRDNDLRRMRMIWLSQSAVISMLLGNSDVSSLSIESKISKSIFATVPILLMVYYRNMYI